MEINGYYNRVRNLKEYINRMKGVEKDSRYKSMMICLENYSVRLEGYLLGTYQTLIDPKDERYLQAAILLRGCIESYLLANIFLHSDEDISTRFYERRQHDLEYIQFKYGRAYALRFNEEINKNTIVHKQDRFDYIGSFEEHPNSLIEVVDYCQLDDLTKRYIKYWIKVADQTVHPTIDYSYKSVEKNLVDEIFGKKGLIGTLEDLVFDLLDEMCEKHYLDQKDIDLLKENSNYEISQWIETELDIEEELFEINHLISSSDILKTLYDEFILNYKDLVWALKNHRKYLFYIKSRFILEVMSIFYILLKHPLEFGTLYRLHHVILRKDLMEYMVKYKGEEAKKIEKEYLLIYEERFNKIKQFYLKKYPHFDLHKLKLAIKQTNGWAIGLVGVKEKAPKTIDLIHYSMNELLKELEGVNQEVMLEYMNGFYVECCEYSHISALPIDTFEEDKNELFYVINLVIKCLFSNIKKSFYEYDLNEEFN